MKPMDLPDANAPLNETEKLVYGATARRHPVTGFPLQMGGHGSSHPAPPPNVQAREHLQIIARENGLEAARAMKARLDEFEASGGAVNMPGPDIPLGFEHALRR